MHYTQAAKPMMNFGCLIFATSHDPSTLQPDSLLQYVPDISRRATALGIHESMIHTVSDVGLLIRLLYSSLCAPQYFTTYGHPFTGHNINTEPPDTIRAPVHEDAVDGVVHAGTQDTHHYL